MCNVESRAMSSIRRQEAASGSHRWLPGAANGAGLVCTHNRALLILGRHFKPGKLPRWSIDGRSLDLMASRIVPDDCYWTKNLTCILAVGSFLHY
jgi:hypothetical protein